MKLKKFKKLDKKNHELFPIEEKINKERKSKV